MEEDRRLVPDYRTALIARIRGRGGAERDLLVVIGGQSIWTAPKGIRLGLQVPALEKLNGKPFTIKGFDKDGVAAATDWQNGAFEQLPGNCGVRVFFRPDPKASATARNAVSSDKEFASTDGVVRAVKPAISEILIGY